MLFKLNLQQFTKPLPIVVDPTDPDEPEPETGIYTYTNNFYLDGTLVNVFTTSINQNSTPNNTQVYLTLSGNDIYGYVSYADITPSAQTIIQSGQLIASNIDKSSFSTTGFGTGGAISLNDQNIAPLTAGTIYSVGYWGDSNTYFITATASDTTNNLKLGDTTINKVYVGNTEIKKVCIGTTTIYEK